MRPIFLAALLFASPVAAQVADTPLDPLPVGNPALRTISLGEAVATLLTGCAHTGVGRGGNITIDWGDGSVFSKKGGTPGESCEDRYVHRYRFPGTYAISVDAWEPGPTDGPIPYFSGRAEVYVDRREPVSADARPDWESVRVTIK